MPKLKNLSGQDVLKIFAKFGFEKVDQEGSHIRMTTRMRREHHVTVPDHKVLPLGTFRAIPREAACHFECTSEEILSRLLGSG